MIAIKESVLAISHSINETNPCRFCYTAEKCFRSYQVYIQQLMICHRLTMKSSNPPDGVWSIARKESPTAVDYRLPPHNAVKPG